jgi:hypothetical protein
VVHHLSEPEVVVWLTARLAWLGNDVSHREVEAAYGARHRPRG